MQRKLEEQPVPDLPSYTSSSGREVRRHPQRIDDRMARIRDGGAPRQSQANQSIIDRSRFVSGINGQSERENWQLVKHIIGG